MNDPSHVPNPTFLAPLPDAPDPGPPDDGHDSAGGQPDEFVVERGGYGVGTDI
jgi:hypothetical protein